MRSPILIGLLSLASSITYFGFGHAETCAMVINADPVVLQFEPKVGMKGTYTWKIERSIEEKGVGKHDRITVDQEGTLRWKVVEVSAETAQVELSFDSLKARVTGSDGKTTSFESDSNSSTMPAPLNDALRGALKKAWQLQMNRAGAIMKAASPNRTDNAGAMMLFGHILDDEEVISTWSQLFKPSPQSPVTVTETTTWRDEDSELIAKGSIRSVTTNNWRITEVAGERVKMEFTTTKDYRIEKPTSVRTELKDFAGSGDLEWDRKRQCAMRGSKHQKGTLVRSKDGQSAMMTTEERLSFQRAKD